MTELGLAGRPLYMGARVARLEDDRLLTGTGRYVADVKLPQMVEVAFVRSPVAHARIRALDVEAARSSPGVLRLVTSDDLADVAPFPDFFSYARPVRTFPLARTKVRYVGSPVVAIVAEDRYRAEDAAESVGFDYEELPAVASLEAALAPGAPRLYDDWPNNTMVEVHGDNRELRETFERARIVRGRYSIQRHTSIPMETRGCLAEFRQGRLTLWTATQSPHIVRTTLSYVLPLAERDIRVIAPDVGGGFGCKTHVYPEEALVSWLAIKLRRPVRWIEDRAEHMVATAHAREHVIELEAAVEEDGKISAVRANIFHDVGSGEILPAGFNPSFVAGGHVTGPYRIPHAEVSVICVVTNKTPSGAFRGFGAPEMVFALERLVEKIATEAGVDSIDLRRRMLLSRSDLPYITATGSVLDSGSFRESFDLTVERAKAAEAELKTQYGDRDDVRIGTGFATYLEGTAPTYFGTTGHWTSYDSASIRMNPDGEAVVSVGVTTTGQGVTTMVATLAADALGIPRDRVTVQIGDTDLCPYGLGGWGSRSTVVGGGAVLKAAGRIREKLLRIAGHMLEASPEDLEIENGIVHVKGSDRPAVPVGDVARAAIVRTVDLPPGVEPGLEETVTYDPPGLQHVPDASGRMNGAAATANATHAAIVKVDLPTGQVEMLRYFATHDCGPMVNPTIVTGQVHGGIAHGVGGALYEHLQYSPEGQLLVAGFMDYLVPSATEIPTMEVEHLESPSPSMPLGVKGAGEGGAIGPPAAIANAVADALSEFGVDVVETPLTPPAVRRLLGSARAVARSS